MNLQAVYAKERFMRLESFIIDIIEARKKSFWTKFLRLFLYPFSLFFKTAVCIKNYLYHKKIFTTHESRVPVISIGNIAAGGTGKTSFISFISSLLPQDKKIAVLSRGYRSKIAHTKAVMEISNGIGPLFPVDFCGDEPYLLAQLIPHARIIVGRDRVKAAKMACDLNADIILLDDGMQFRRLKRDLEVVLLHADDLFGKNAFLPYGYLRDDPKRLQMANLIVIHQIKCQKKLSDLTTKIRKYSEAPIIATKVHVEEIFDVKTKQPIAITGKKVGIFCSIGNPSSFVSTLSTMKCEIVDHLFFPDHSQFNKKQVFAFAKNCKEKGAETLLCTEKDGVKITDYFHCDLPVSIVKTSLKLVSGEDVFAKFMEKIHQLGKRQ